LQSTNEVANNNTFLGKKEKDFEFVHLLPIKVDFAECSASNVDSEKPVELEVLEKWLINIA
jgi:signal recognition particle receptor subunit beta